MKNITKMFSIFILIAVIILVLAACKTEADDNKDGPTHYANTLTISGQQVWGINFQASSPRDQYYKFTEDRDINVFIRFYDENSIETGKENTSVTSDKVVGSGKIEKGILSFNVGKPEPEDLQNWNVLKSREFFFWHDAVVDVPEVNGTQYMLITTGGNRLNKETIVGTRTSISQEIVRFIYVDRDCKITGTSGNGKFGSQNPAFYITNNKLDLSLKKGWNTVWRKETYENITGDAQISMEIKNPDHKWAIYLPRDY